MVLQRVNNLINIDWIVTNPPLLLEDSYILEVLPYKLPKDYVQLLNFSNGGIIDYSFTYFDVAIKTNIVSSCSCIHGININSDSALDLVKEYNDPPDLFPMNIVAFSETGNGDMICFDYRNDIFTDEPQIVYWNHESSGNEDISFIADSFRKFISLLIR